MMTRKLRAVALNSVKSWNVLSVSQATAFPSAVEREKKAKGYLLF
jgi:hypothetical protein